MTNGAEIVNVHLSIQGTNSERKQQLQTIFTKTDSHNLIMAGDFNYFNQHSLENFAQTEMGLTEYTNSQKTLMKFWKKPVLKTDYVFAKNVNVADVKFIASSKSDHLFISFTSSGSRLR